MCSDYFSTVLLEELIPLPQGREDLQTLLTYLAFSHLQPILCYLILFIIEILTNPSQVCSQQFSGSSATFSASCSNKMVRSSLAYKSANVSIFFIFFEVQKPKSLLVCSSQKHQEQLAELLKLVKCAT